MNNKLYIRSVSIMNNKPPLISLRDLVSTGSEPYTDDASINDVTWLNCSRKPLGKKVTV